MNRPNGVGCLLFWYHMHGADINSLTVYKKVSAFWTFYMINFVMKNPCCIKIFFFFSKCSCSQDLKTLHCGKELVLKEMNGVKQLLLSHRIHNLFKFVDVFSCYFVQKEFLKEYFNWTRRVGFMISFVLMSNYSLNSKLYVTFRLYFRVNVVNPTKVTLQSTIYNSQRRIVQLQVEDHKLYWWWVF